MKPNKKILVWITLTLVMIIIVFVFNSQFKANPVEAGSSENVSGFAWSSSIGWISFNCTNNVNDPSCSFSIDYGVNLINGVFSGFAWSSNLGWIKFDGLGPNYPTGPGTTADDAELDLATNEVSGWARACAGTEPGNCTVPSRDDGWDGWISLRGTASNGTPYGVIYDPGTSTLQGFAWGGQNVGWISFSGTAGDGTPYAVSIDIDAPVVDLRADGQNPLTLPFGGGTVEMTWTSQNVSDCVDPADVWMDTDTTNTIPDVPSSSMSLSSPGIFFTTVTTTILYISCDGGAAIDSVTITVLSEDPEDPTDPPGPTDFSEDVFIDLDASLLLGFCEPSFETKLTWGYSLGDESKINTAEPCDVNEWQTPSGQQLDDVNYSQGQSGIDVIVDHTQSFTIECYDTDGASIWDYATVNCIPTDPVLNFFIDIDGDVSTDDDWKESILLSSGGGDVTLTWTSEFVEDCKTLSTGAIIPPLISSFLNQVSDGYYNVGNSWNSVGFDKQPTPTNPFNLPGETYNVIGNTGFFMHCRSSKQGGVDLFATVAVYVQGDDEEIPLPPGWENIPGFSVPPRPLGIPIFEER